MCIIVIDNHYFIWYEIHHSVVSMINLGKDGYCWKSMVRLQGKMSRCSEPFWTFCPLILLHFLALFHQVTSPCTDSLRFPSAFNFFTSPAKNTIFPPAAERPRLLNLCKNFDYVFPGHILCPLVHVHPYFQQLVPCGCFHEHKNAVIMKVGGRS